MNQRRFFSVQAACCFFIFASLGSANATRIYFNGDQAVEVSESAAWWLIDAQDFNRDRLARLDLKGLDLVRIEPLTPGRYGIQFGDTVDLQEQFSILDNLIKAAVVRRYWRAVERFGDVGFFDDRISLRTASGLPPVTASLGLYDLRRTEMDGVWTALALDGDAIGTANQARRHPNIIWAEPDLIRHVQIGARTNDAQLAEQWHLEAENDTGDIDVSRAWDITLGHASAVIAIFDNGFDMGHPDLESNIVGAFDAIDGDTDPEAPCIETPDGAGPAGSCPQARPYRASHGTAVAGVAAARGNNRALGSGVCPRCGLYPVRMLGGGGVRSVSTANAFQRAARDGAAVINNSWGPSLTRFFPLSRAESEVLNRITKAGRDGLGVVVIFAAGNDYFTPANVNPYASHPEVIAVSASTRLDDFACYSNYGSVISVSAPSKGCNQREPGLWTTDHRGAEGYSNRDIAPDFGGTSAAAPVVAGLAGLILSARPDLTAQQVRLIIESTADKIRANKNDWERSIGLNLDELFSYDKYGYSRGFGYGRINAGRALEMAVNDPPQSGALCSKACGSCVDDRCAPPCTADEECSASTQCLPIGGGAKACLMTRPASALPGEPCAEDCEICVQAPDSEFVFQSICTEECADDSDCLFGFDCRPVEEMGMKVCVPGNKECGQPWGQQRCQSEVVVEGNGEAFCSCECIPNQPGACPEGFKCSNVQCQRVRGGIRCAAVEQFRDANYPPQCVPDPDVKRPCDSHLDCSSGLFCIDGFCSPDREPEGCDTCTVCVADEECSDGSSCVDTPRGKRCLTPCEPRADEPCRGDMRCANIPGPPSFHCVNPDFDRKGVCPRAWRCQLEGR
ncbi:MAG: S8 family serine peptidase, partial [Bradymonadia bacterium]